MEGKKNLRKGHTTGACAAAAAKAAATSFFTGKRVREVEITLPIGKTVLFQVHRCETEKGRALASVIKDAGDDPDVTNGAEIVAEIQAQGSRFKAQENKAFEFKVHTSHFTVCGGKGIGIVTKPGLAVPVGEPAINPVPRKMIENAIKEAIQGLRFKIQDSNIKTSAFSLTISAPNGEEIAKKTMNARLGIIGGISILGTTGIVEPVSLSAYRDSITCAIDVATAAGCNEMVFSTGRSSEKIAEQILKLPEEAFILVGDHMGFALKKVRSQKPAPAGFKRGSKARRVIIVGQFGKFSKLAAGHFETHCSDSSIEMEFLANLAKEAVMEQADRVGVGETATRLPRSKIIESVKSANTARHVFFMLKEQGLESVYKTVCNKVKENAEKIVKGKVALGCMLVGYNNEVVERI